MTESRHTPFFLILGLSDLVIRVCDRLLGNRAQSPALVAGALQHGLARAGQESHLVYGKSAWVEIDEQGNPLWAHSMNEETPYFWCMSAFEEVIDLNKASSKRMPSDHARVIAYSPPNIWSKELPRFVKYETLGIAELQFEGSPLEGAFVEIKKAIDEKINDILSGEPPYPSEPIIGPTRKLLDNQKKDFAHFDRALATKGFPEESEIHSPAP